MKTTNDGKTYILTDISYREMILIACGLEGSPTVGRCPLVQAF